MLETYLQRIERFQTEIAAAEAKSLRASNLRGFLFVSAIACMLIVGYAGVPVGISILLVGLGVALLVIFFVIVIRHRRITEQIERARHLKRLNEEGVSRLARKWSEFPVPATPPEFNNHGTAKDLDLFGNASLFHLINTTTTPGGRLRLAHWLAEPADPETAMARQHAVAELAPMIDWRQELHFAGRELLKLDQAVRGQLFHKSAPPSFCNNPAMMFAAYAIPVVFTGLVLGQILGYSHVPWWILPLVAMGLLNSVFKRKIADAVGEILREEKALEAYEAIFEKLEQLESASGWLKRQHEGVDGAHVAVAQLCSYATSFAARRSVVYPLLKYGLMWDFHVACKIEKWHLQYNTHVDGWFDALAQIEATAALGNLHHDEPDWVFPKFTEEKSIVARELGHPLIAAKTRVCNDLTIDPPGKFLLVTGSNMSGKSTLLRSLGLNVVLAHAGAPTCSTNFHLPSVQLVTSLRVEESLTEGVSFFMAELLRIKSAVRLADDPPEGRLVLYLFDEILRGTNSVERQVIVQRLIGHLLERETIGAITTHDLALAEIEELKPASKAVHFREQFQDTPDGPKMTFDYKLREGLATTTNAIKLLEMIDLDL